MAFVSKALNFIKDGYLKAVSWIDTHPHKTFWLGGVASVGQFLAWLVF